MREISTALIEDNSSNNEGKKMYANTIKSLSLGLILTGGIAAPDLVAAKSARGDGKTTTQPSRGDVLPEDIISDACDGEYILIFGPDGSIEEWDCA